MFWLSSKRFPPKGQYIQIVWSDFSTLMNTHCFVDQEGLLPSKNKLAKLGDAIAIASHLKLSLTYPLTGVTAWRCYIASKNRVTNQRYFLWQDKTNVMQVLQHQVPVISLSIIFTFYSLWVVDFRVDCLLSPIDTSPVDPFLRLM